MVNRMRAARDARPPGARILVTILFILFILSKCRRRCFKLTQYPGGKNFDAAGQHPCASVHLSVFICVLLFRAPLSAP